MKLNKIAILSLFIVLICLMGAASATEDADDIMTVDSTSVDDIDNADEIGLDVSTDTQDEDICLNEQTTTRAAVNVTNWSELDFYCNENADYTITLTGTSYVIESNITFNNNAYIIGTSSSYITGGSTSKTPFKNTNPALTLHFLNVKFQNVNAKNLLELDGTVYFENCTFDNVQTATGHNSVIYNTNNLMYLTGCNITNCNTGYGAVSNYNSGSTTSPVMYVDDCKFINNTASVEPGAINNCGILYVNNSEFTNNHANWWAGAIHTHSNAQTEIKNSIFRKNTAGWNGGALFTYSRLDIYNSTFEDNNCTTNNGGGAIGAYNYGSTYNLTIDSCRFDYNTNLCYAYTNVSTTSVGRGGAISVLNGGYLNVYNSNFTGNYAKIGQAIAAATYTYENGTGGNPHIKISNNRFVNHTATGIDTIVITGNDYIFNNNTFINSYQNTSYAGVGNTYNSIGNAASVSSKPNQKLKIEKNSPDFVLSEFNPEILSEGKGSAYVNSSLDGGKNDGSSWENAFNNKGNIAYLAIIRGLSALRNMENVTEATLYISDYEYNRGLSLTGEKHNYTLKAVNHVNFPKVWLNVEGCGPYPDKYVTFINFSFGGGDIGYHANFINCTFTGPITIANALNNYDPIEIVESGYDQTYFMNFYNCTFKDVNTTNAFITLNKYGALNFNNCTFENITADSLVYHKEASYFQDDGVSFKNCTFTNSKYNGIVDSAANFDDAIAIEDCNYDGEVTVGTTEVDGHFYVNATKLKVVAVETSISINSSQRGIVTITVSDIAGNPVANATVNYMINGENKSGVSDENGIITISGLTGIVMISATFDGNEAYLASNNTADFNFTIPKVATALSASGKTIYLNVISKGYSYKVTLKDANGKVLANKKVTVTIDGKTYSAKTSSSGVATIKIKATKTGTKKAVIKFAGDSGYKASTKTVTIKVIKEPTKIVANKKTFKVKAKTKKYSVVLKTSSNKPIYKGTVYLKVNGKTYKAITDSKGKATFKITKLTKKGKFSATVKYSGNKYYNPANKKVLITTKR